jgi:plastocyanin
VRASRTDARTRSARRARRASIPFAVLLAIGAIAALLSPSAAPAAPGAGCDGGTPVGPTQTTYKCNIPTGTIGGYEVRQWFDLAPTPPQNGFITHMETDIVDDVTGEPVPISRLMLHHIVFLNVNRPDNTCRGFRGFDSRDNYLGGASAQRFYAAGEERAKFSMPPGYGYQTNQNNTWGVVAMVMNHRSSADHALIHYEVTIDSSPLTAVEPYWLDVRDCRADPIYNIPSVAQKAKKAKKNKKGRKAAEATTAKKKSKKGKKKRKKKVAAPTTNETRDYVIPESGRLIGGAGHVHGGAIGLKLTEPNCGNRQVAESTPTWGLSDHPFYNVRPILHEPGPINMSAFGSTTGLPVHEGETLRLNSIYDNSLPHVRVMGIMVVYLAPDSSVQQDCGPIPNWEILKTNQPGRSGPIPFTIPLTGLDANGQATTINAPPGAIQQAGRNTVVNVGDRFFGAPNLRVKQGSWLTWQFNGQELHNVTLANGPLGIGTDNLDDGRSFTQKLDRPGTYRFFCALHPVQMQERVIVTPKKKHKKKKR